ncbi:MAG: nucleotidyltransferase family protein [Colwellia sp.]|nr:nucleotidyltransferase family protein [Colwellia sp.]
MKIAALIMAAGQASRFKGCKHLAQIDKYNMLQQAITTLQATKTDDIYIVSGAWHDEFTKEKQHKKLQSSHIIHYNNWSNGLGSSIAFAVTQLAQNYDAILITLADQVAVTTEDLSKLLTAFKGENIACAVYAEKRGCPAIFGANSYQQLMSLSGDSGAKSVLYHKSNTVSDCNMPNAAIDIDTKQQLCQWQARLKSQ